MALQVSKRVWDQTKEIKESDKVMLLALADKADESGICWPRYDTSYDTLSSMVSINRRSAIRIVEKLEEWGHVYVDEHAVGRGNSNTFFIVSGLTSAEIETVLIDRFGKDPSEAALCATSLLNKQDDHRKGVMGNTKKFPKKRKKGVTDSTNGVTNNTISDEKKGVTGDKKVLPVTQKGVTGNTQSMSPSSSLTPNGVGDKPPPEPDKPKKQLMGIFTTETGLKMPHRKSDVSFWWSSIREIYEIVDNDVGAGSDLIRQVVKKMRADGLTISNPNSIINICRTLAAEKSVTRNGKSPHLSAEQLAVAKQYDQELAQQTQRRNEL